MPWVKGQSGNPKGSPKKARAMANALRAALREKTPDGETKRRAIACKLADMALAGDLDAIKLIYERMDGKVPEVRQVTGDEGGAVEIVLRWADDGGS